MNRLVIFALLALATLAQAQDLPTVDDILARFEEAGNELESFTADFEQRELDEFGDTNTKTGTIYFLAPGRYLLVTMLNGKPLEEVGKNQEHAWRIRHHVKTVDHVDVDNEQEVSEGYSFADADDLRKSFELEVDGIEELETGMAWHLKGTPKEDASLESFEVWINIENPSPVVKLQAEKKRIRETMIFTNIRRNVEIDPELFKYEVPSGYTVHER